MNGYKMRPNNQTLENFGATFIGSAHLQSLPKNVDWRKMGAVTAVKDQVSLKKNSKGAKYNFLFLVLFPFYTLTLNAKSVGLLHVAVVRGHIYPYLLDHRETIQKTNFSFSECFLLGEIAI